MGDWEARLAGYTEDQQQLQQQQQHNVADATVAAPHQSQPSQSQQPTEQQQTWDNLGDVMHVDWGAWGWHEQPQSQQPSSQQDVTHQQPHQHQATETPASGGGGGSITSPASAARYLQEAFFAHSQSQSQPQNQAGPSIPMDAGAGGVGTHHRPVPHRGHTLPSLPMDQPTEEGDRFAWFDQHLPHALNHPTHSRLSVSSALAYEAPSMSAPAPPPPSSSSTPAQTPVLPRPISPLSAFLQDHFGQPPPPPPPPHTQPHSSGSTFTPPSRAFVPPGVPVPSQQPKRGRTDVHPRSQSHSRPSSRSANRAAAAAAGAGSGGPSPSSTSSSPVGARGPSTPYTPINHPTASSSSTSNATPASASGPIATGRGAPGRTGEGLGEGGPTDPPSPTGTVTVEEDRRLRNTAASAKFRQKRKHYVERLHREVDELTGRREVLYHEVEELKKENGFLKVSAASERAKEASPYLRGCSPSMIGAAWTGSVRYIYDWDWLTRRKWCSSN